MTSCFGLEDQDQEIAMVLGTGFTLIYDTGPNGSPDNSIAFPGDNFIIVPNEALALDVIYDFTILLSIKPTASQNALLYKYGPSDTGVAIRQVGLNVQFEVPARNATSTTADDTILTTGDPLIVGDWNYIAVTHDFDTGNVAIHVNNTEVTSGTVSQRVVASNNNVKLGQDGSDTFSGSMSCVQIYDTLLTAQQIADKETCPISKFKISDVHNSGVYI